MVKCLRSFSLELMGKMCETKENDPFSHLRRTNVLLVLKRFSPSYIYYNSITSEINENWSSWVNWLSAMHISLSLSFYHFFVYFAMALLWHGCI